MTLEIRHLSEYGHLRIVLLYEETYERVYLGYGK